MTKHYFVNKRTGRRYEIIKVDGDKVTLKGEYREFSTPFDKANFKKMGYTLERAQI